MAGEGDSKNQSHSNNEESDAMDDYNSMPEFSMLAAAVSQNLPSTSASNGTAGSSNSNKVETDPLADLKPEEKQRVKMHLLVSSFSREQLNRYEMFKRSTLSKPTLRRILQQVAGAQVNQSVVIAIAGIAKVFAGEVLEEALDLRDAAGESSEPVKPKHLRAALGRLQRKGNPVPRMSRRSKKYFRKL